MALNIDLNSVSSRRTGEQAFIFERGNCQHDLSTLRQSQRLTIKSIIGITPDGIIKDIPPRKIKA